jgi:hypothetical protein
MGTLATSIPAHTIATEVTTRTAETTTYSSPEKSKSPYEAAETTEDEGYLLKSDIELICLVQLTQIRDDDDDIEFLEVLARTQDDTPPNLTPPHSVNPFVSLYDAHPELELERNTLAQVSRLHTQLLRSLTTLLATRSSSAASSIGVRRDGPRVSRNAIFVRDTVYH